jgi:hypothetical protein
MRAKDLVSSLSALIPTGRPVFVWGPPGVGKSYLVKQVAAAMGKELLDVRAVLMDPTDVKGLPAVNGDKLAHWCPPAFMPRDPNSQGILFLDELAQANSMTQSAYLQLTLDRKCGEYVLPDGWTVVAASNRQEDRAGAHRLISPLLNRFIHLDLEVHTDDWLAWALDSGVATEVRSFIAFRPGMLFNFRPDAGERAFPTPRSWEFVSQVLPAAPENLLHSIVSGCVGEGPAAEFVGFCKIHRELPDMDKVLASPDTAKVPSEPAVLWATCGVLVDKAKAAKGTPSAAKTWSAVTRFAIRMPKEFGALLMRDVFTVTGGKIAETPEGQKWLRENSDLILAGK